MEDVSVEYSLLTGQARRSIKSLLQDLSYPGDQPSLVQHLRVEIEALAAQNDDMAEEFAELSADDQARVHVANELRHLVNRLSVLQGVSALARSARSPVLDLGSLYFLRRAAEAMTGSAVEVVGHPEFEYAMEPLWELGIAVAPGESVTPIVVVFPQSDTRTILLHPVLLHELAHYCIEVFSLTDSVLSDAGAGSEEHRAEAIEALKSDLAASEEAATGVLERRLSDWLDEILCDALATAYGGPSYLAAFLTIALMDDAELEGDRHPPVAIRLRFLLTQLKDVGWLDVLGPEWTPILELADRLAGFDPSLRPADVAFLCNEMRRFSPLVHSRAKDTLGASALDPRAVGAVTNPTTVGGQLIEMLRNRILAAVLADGTPADPRAVLAVGWSYALQESTHDLTNVDGFLSDDRFQAFLAKSCEMSSIATAWTGCAPVT